MVEQSTITIGNKTTYIKIENHATLFFMVSMATGMDGGRVPLTSTNNDVALHGDPNSSKYQVMVNSINR